MNELDVVDCVVCEARSSSGHHGKSSGERASWKQTEPQPQSSQADLVREINLLLFRYGFGIFSCPNGKMTPSMTFLSSPCIMFLLNCLPFFVKGIFCTRLDIVFVLFFLFFKTTIMDFESVN